MDQQTIDKILEDLVSANLGKPVEREDPSNLDECFDWIFAVVDALGIPRSAIRHLDAKDIFLNPNAQTKQYFDLIPNSPDFKPQKWDIGVFGTDVGTAGHVVLCSGNNNALATFQSTDQNWNGNKFIEYVWHQYGGPNYFLGVLRPKLSSLSAPVQQGSYFVNGDLKLDYTNKDSMLVAFNVWVQLERGELVPKAQLDALQQKENTLSGDEEKYKEIESIVKR